MDNKKTTRLPENQALALTERVLDHGEALPIAMCIVRIALVGLAMSVLLANALIALVKVLLGCGSRTACKGS